MIVYREIGDRSLRKLQLARQFIGVDGIHAVGGGPDTIKVFAESSAAVTVWPAVVKAAAPFAVELVESPRANLCLSTIDD